MTRQILLVAHPRRPDWVPMARDIVTRLGQAGVEVAVEASDAAELEIAGSEHVHVAQSQLAGSCELVLVLGGDGTILRAAEYARGAQVPLLGVNLGHVGFLAEVERDGLDDTVERIVARDYVVEERMTLDVTCHGFDGSAVSSWALNEVAVEKAARERMLETSLSVDGRPISSFGCDGIIVSTPTGSTAYAFSAGGPVMWPSVEAMLVVPNAAHALFARPLVLAPDSSVVIDINPDAEGAGVMWCDGRRHTDLTPGASIEVNKGALPVHLARFNDEPFSTRLVAKLDLPVHGWRAMRTVRAQGSSAC